MTREQLKEKIISRMIAECAVNISDGEIHRTLADCVAGQRLIEIAKYFRNTGILKQTDLPAERYDTYKRCKCGNMMQVHYTIYEGGPWEIGAVDTDGEGSSCILRRRSKAWPNSVWCIGCMKIHRLETFKRLEQ